MRKEPNRNRYTKVVISIAGIRVGIYSRNPDISELISVKCASFLSKSKPIFVLNIEPQFWHGTWFLKIRLEYDNKRLNRGIENETKILQDKCCYSLKANNKNGEPHIMSFLCSLYANILLHNQGVVVHSASLIKNHNGYLFFGKSGSGKTTVAKSAIGHSDILGDDQAFIRKVNGAYAVFGSPFFGKITKKPDPVNKAAPIKAIYNLIKAKSDHVEKINKNKAIFFITGSITLPIRDDKREYKKAIDTITDLVDNVPVYNLYFTKECNFWRLIR